MKEYPKFKPLHRMGPGGIRYTICNKCESVIDPSKHVDDLLCGRCKKEAEIKYLESWK